MPLKYVNHEIVHLRSHPEYSEKWVQDRIAEDPSIVGLGDVVLRDRERTQLRAGRLDLLLQDTDTKRRYEVELQLGATDETHIIRTVEYWDIERKRYPQYEHCAVIIAEEITSRFLNVISLFNGTIPLIAIQVRAIKVGETISLVFTRVLDEMSRGLVEEDEDAAAAPADRAYWEKRASKESVALADIGLEMARKHDSTFQLKYNKFYIGLARDGHPFNFMTFRPRRTAINLELKLPQESEIDSKLSDAGINTLEYSTRWSIYRLQLTKSEIAKHQTLLSELIERAYMYRKEQ